MGEAREAFTNSEVTFVELVIKICLSNLELKARVNLEAA